MRTHLLLPFILLSLCFSCNKRERLSDTYITPKTVIIKVPSDISFSSFDKVIKKMDFVPLETLDRCLISRIIQLKCTDSLIFINDNRHRVLVFEKNGKFRNQIGHYGAGPGECKEVRDFILCEDTVKILDFCKIECYSFDGQHLLTQRSDFGDIRISPNFFINSLSSDGYYFWAGTTGHNDKESRKKYHFMYKTNNEFQLTDSIFPIRHSAGGNTKKFIRVDSCIVLDPLFADYHIYQISKDNKVSARYTLDFGDKTLTDDILESIDRKHEELFNEELHKYIIQMFDFEENSKWVLLNFIYRQKMYCMLYSKEKREAFILPPGGSALEKGEFLFWGAQVCMNNQFVYCLETSWFTEIVDQLSDEAKKKYGLDKECYKNIKNMDNHILLFYTMKDD